MIKVLSSSDKVMISPSGSCERFLNNPITFRCVRITDGTNNPSGFIHDLLAEHRGLEEVRENFYPVAGHF